MTQADHWSDYERWCFGKMFSLKTINISYSTMFHKSVCHTIEKDETHHSDTKAKRENYNSSVNKMVSMFDSSFIDPFNTKKAPAGLVNFSTCQQTTEEILMNMISCIDIGEDMLKKCVSERLETKPDGSNPPVKSFFSPMTRSKVKTMAVNKKTNTSQAHKQNQQ